MYTYIKYCMYDTTTQLYNNCNNNNNTNNNIVYRQVVVFCSIASVVYLYVYIISVEVNRF